MNSFRRALRWWIFLPLAPVLVALISNYWAEVFYQLGLHRMQRASELILLLDIFALLPYMTLDFVVFGAGASHATGWLLFRVSLFAILTCLIFYFVTLIVDALDQKWGHRFHINIRVSDDAITAGTLVGAALGILCLLLWIAENFRGASALIQAVFAVAGAIFLVFALVLALWGKRWIGKSLSR
jgi:hypothetical protein